MAIIKAVSSRSSIGRAIKYITQDEKTKDKLISGLECSPDTAIEEMKTTKELWQKTDGRQYKHFVQSFAPEEKLTAEQAHEIAKKLCENRFKGHETLIATHQDKDHFHSHIIVNSVNHENGHKLQLSKADLQQMKDRSDELCKEKGLSITEKGEEITTYKKEKYKALERAGKEGYKSYVLDCYKAVLSAKRTAISREDFITKMREQNFEVKWNDKRKHITFSDENGNKVRNSNLEKTFKEALGKENLENGFEINFESELVRARIREPEEKGSRGLETNTGIEQSSRKVETDDTELAIGNFKDKIGKSKTEVSHDDGRRAHRHADEKSLERERNRIEKQSALQKGLRNRSLER